MTSVYRNLPAVETLIQVLQQRMDSDNLPHTLLATVQEVLAGAPYGASRLV